VYCEKGRGGIIPDSLLPQMFLQWTKREGKRWGGIAAEQEREVRRRRRACVGGRE
jgi:hypothetical protein